MTFEEILAREIATGREGRLAATLARAADQCGISALSAATDSKLLAKYKLKPTDMTRHVINRASEIERQWWQEVQKRITFLNETPAVRITRAKLNWSTLVRKIHAVLIRGGGQLTPKAAYVCSRQLAAIGVDVDDAIEVLSKVQALDEFLNGRRHGV